MDRRSFLRALSIAAAGVGAHALDLDKLLWVPGQKTIFLPSTEAVSSFAGLTHFTIGDVITIDGVFAMNPVTGRRTPHQQMFVVTDTVTPSRFNLSPSVHPELLRHGAKSGAIRGVWTSPIPGKKLDANWSHA